MKLVVNQAILHPSEEGGNMEDNEDGSTPDSGAPNKTCWR